ncbi:substrate-binding periplasmic protein [Vreelandella sp. EE22]
MADTPLSFLDLTYVSEEYPPYNYAEKGVVQGRAVELLRRLFLHSQTPFESVHIHIFPWVRAYNLTLQTPNTVLFSTTKTPTREALFHWAGPIAIDHVALMAPPDSSLRIEALNDAIAQDLSIVVIREDIGELSLAEAGYPERLIHRALNNRSALSMLMNQRVDLWAYSANVARWLAEREGYVPSTLEPVYTLSDHPLYFAINKQSDPGLTARFQQAIDELSKLDIPQAVYQDE